MITCTKEEKSKLHLSQSRTSCVWGVCCTDYSVFNAFNKKFLRIICRCQHKRYTWHFKMHWNNSYFLVVIIFTHSNLDSMKCNAVGMKSKQWKKHFNRWIQQHTHLWLRTFTDCFSWNSWKEFAFQCKTFFCTSQRKNTTIRRFYFTCDHSIIQRLGLVH